MTRTTRSPLFPADVDVDPIAPLAARGSERVEGSIASLNLPLLDLSALIPTRPLRSRADFARAKQANSLVRDVIETMKRGAEAQVEMQLRQQELRVKVAEVDDQVSAIQATIKVREAVVPRQIDLALAQLDAKIRLLMPAEPRTAPAAATDDFEALWAAADEHSRAARTAVTNGRAGITKPTPSAPYNALGALLYREARGRHRKDADAVREAFLTLRGELATGAVDEELLAAAATTLTEQARDARRQSNLADIAATLRGVAGGSNGGAA